MKFKVKNTKGIILAGGSGTRLNPISKVFSKQLFPVYDRPMIYYPFNFLTKLGIKNISIISDKKNIFSIKKIINIYKKKGQKINFLIQKKPNGLPEAYLIANKFIKNSNTVMILGDNIFLDLDKSFFGKSFKNLAKGKSTIFGYRVKDPRRFGVVELSKKNIIKKIVEKPQTIISKIAIVGLYFFTKDVVKNVKKLKPSRRSELEIIDLMNIYLSEKKLNLEIISKKSKWFDAGTFDSILKVSNFIRNKQIR